MPFGLSPASCTCTQAAPQELAAALIQDTVKLLPVQPSQISHVNGPYVQVQQVHAACFRRPASRTRGRTTLHNAAEDVT